MACHEKVLEAAREITARKGINEFAPEEVITYLKSRGTKYKESTIRTHVVSRCTINAPAHHKKRYPYFERISYSLYKVRK